MNYGAHLTWEERMLYDEHYERRAFKHLHAKWAEANAPMANVYVAPPKSRALIDGHMDWGSNHVLFELKVRSTECIEPRDREKSTLLTASKQSNMTKELYKRLWEERGLRMFGKHKSSEEALLSCGTEWRQLHTRVWYIEFWPDQINLHNFTPYAVGELEVKRRPTVAREKDADRSSAKVLQDRGMLPTDKQCRHISIGDDDRLAIWGNIEGEKRYDIPLDND